MRIACPACNAAYSVPDVQLSEARMVRCARCGTEWAPLDMVRPSEVRTPEPMIETPAPAEDAAIETAPMAIEDEIPIPVPVPTPTEAVLPTPTVKARMPVSLVVAWVLSVGVVAAGVAGLFVGHDRVMAAWPPSARLYAAVGLAGHKAPAAGHGSEGRE